MIECSFGEKQSHLGGQWFWFCSNKEFYLHTVPENLAKYCIATFRAIFCLFREGNPHRMHCKILYTL